MNHQIGVDPFEKWRGLLRNTIHLVEAEHHRGTISDIVRVQMTRDLLNATNRVNMLWREYHDSFNAQTIHDAQNIAQNQEHSICTVRSSA